MGWIKSIAVYEFDGKLDQTIIFEAGLNILSGVNGTGKTTVLKRLKDQIGTDRIQKEGTISKIVALSPKRNAEKKAFQTSLQFMKQQNRLSETVLNEFASRTISDHTFEKYESFGDIYGYEFQDRCRTGGDQIEVMNKLTEEYDKVIKSVFPEYELITSWNDTVGSPDVKLSTKYGVPLDLSLMSCGETEVMALMFNVYFNKENTDVYIIDEPEVHLNWSLEKGLFTFFDNFCTDHQKQIIVTSHSRVIFDPKFRNKVQFFVFRDKKVFIEQDPPKESLEEIAGETVAIISTTAPTQKTFFVEDTNHQIFIQKLLALYSTTAEVVIVKDASGMITNLYKLLKSNAELNSKWVNAYLMIDGDGKEEQYKTEPRFIHLMRHCVESYFFDISTTASVLNTTEEELKKEILGLIKVNSKYFNGNHKLFIEQLLGKISYQDVNLELMSFFDASDLLNKLLKTRRIKIETFMKDYLAALKTAGTLELLIDKKLIDAIKA